MGSDEASKEPRKPPRRSVMRTLVWCAAFLFIALLLLVAVAPSLIIGPLVRPAVARAVAEATGYRTELSRVALRWFDVQEVTGLRLYATDGSVIADLSGRVEGGLWSVIFAANAEELPVVDVQGRVTAAMARDGALGLGRSVPLSARGEAARERKDAQPGERTKSSAPAGAVWPPMMGRWPAVTLRLSGIDVDLVFPEAAEGERSEVALRGLRGTLRAEDREGGGRVQLLLDSDDRSEFARVQVNGHLTGFLSPDGAISLDAAWMEVEAALDRLAVPYAAQVPSVERVTLRISSDRLTERALVELSASGDREEESGEPVQLRARLTIGRPFASDGRSTMRAEAIEGTVSAQAIPLALLQPFVADGPIRLSEDIGARASIEAVIAAEESAASDASALSVRVVADLLEAHVSARRSAQEGVLLREGRVHVTWRPTEASITRLFEDQLPWTPEFELTAEDLSVLLTASDVPGAMPDMYGRISAAARGVWEGELMELALRAARTDRDEPLAMELRAERGEDRFHAQAAVTLPLSDQEDLLVSVISAQGRLDGSWHERLVAPLDLALTVEPIAVKGAWWTAEAWRDLPIVGEVRIPRLVVQTAEDLPDLTVLDIVAPVSGGLRDGSPFGLVRVTGAASFDEPDRSLFAFGADVDPMARTGAVQLSDLHVRNMERFLDLPARSLVDRIGARGAINLVVEPNTDSDDPISAMVAFDFPQLDGALPINLHDEVLRIAGGSIQWQMTESVLQTWIDGTQGDDPSGLRARGSALVRAEITSVSLPIALLIGDAPADVPASLEISLTSEGPSWTLAADPDRVYSLSGFRLNVDAPSLEGNTAIKLAGDVREGRSVIGEVALDGRVRGLVQEGRFATDAAVMTAEGSVRAVPTHVLDRFLELDGYLTAAIGDALTADLSARNLSRTRGTLDLAVRSPAATLDVQLVSRENVLQIRPANPLVAELELQPALRDRLLRRIHPIFADVRTTRQPIRVVSTETLYIPTNGDVSTLRGRLELTVGDVELDGGSSLLTLFAIFDRSDRVSLLSGSIDPIDVRIRSGVVEYERFAVRVDRLTLEYRGRIDLVGQTADLRMEIPLSQINHGLREIEEIADRISVPIVTRGPLRDLRTRIDPDFDVGKAALDAGLRRGLDELIRPGRLPLGGLLDDLLRRPR